MKAKSLKIITLSMVILLCFTNLFGCFLFQKQETPNDRFLAKLANVPVEYDCVEFTEEQVDYLIKIDEANLYYVDIDTVKIQGEAVESLKCSRIIEDINCWEIKYQNKEIVLSHDYFKQISTTYNNICSFIDEESEKFYTNEKSIINADKTIDYEWYYNYLNLQGIYIINEELYVVFFHEAEWNQWFYKLRNHFPHVLFKMDLKKEQALYCGYYQSEDNMTVMPNIKLKTEVSNEEIS